MSTTYSLYLQNSSGSRNQYAVFTAPPTLNPQPSGVDVYSNVWMSWTIADTAYKSVDITKTFYAWCGQAKSSYGNGVVVSGGQAKLVQLGTKAVPGTTLSMVNDSGTPTFKDATTHTALPGCFEIKNGLFTSNLNFLEGMAAPDENGRMVPTGSFAPQGNTSVNVQPNVIFYIGVQGAATGTAFDYSYVSTLPAVIDFAKAPGQYGAIITHHADGSFDVGFTSTRAEHLYLIERMESANSPMGKDLKELKDQLTDLKFQLGMDNPRKMTGSITWRAKPSNVERADLVAHMNTGMEAYYTNYHSTDAGFQMFIQNADGTGLNPDQVRYGWNAAYVSLSRQIRDKSHDLGVAYGTLEAEPIEQPQPLPEEEDLKSLGTSAAPALRVR